MKLHRTRSRTRLAAIFLPSAIALAACGGSDDPAPVVPAGPTLTLSGTAATGAAIAGGAVDAKCAGGSGSATTGTDGSYRIALEQGALPCVLRVTKDGTVLHSLASGSGASAKANLTPVSELVVARLAGGDPAGFFSGYEAAGAPSAAQVQAAVDAVVATLKSAGVDLSGTDVLGGTLVAANGSTAGNAFDQALDALNAKLEDAGITLVELRDTVVRESPAAPPAALSTTPSLPADLLLRPAAANCSALRSGKYRVVFFMPTGSSEAATDTVTLNAATLGVVNSDGSTGSLVANGNCRYNTPNGDLFVSQAGVGVLRGNEDGTQRVGMLFPEQTHPVSALAGDWNLIGLGDVSDSGLPQLFAAMLSVDIAGRATGGKFCDDLKTCATFTPAASEAFVANPKGGFDFDGSRAFAYRSGGGELMVLLIDPDGSMTLATRKVTRTLSPIGTVNRSLNFTLARDYSSPTAASDSENTTVSHSADGLSWTRTAVFNFVTGVTRPETVQINVPLDGFIRRVPQTVTNSDGTTSNVGEWVALPLRGTGIVPVAVPASQQLVFSVNKP